MGVQVASSNSHNTYYMAGKIGEQPITWAPTTVTGMLFAQ